jgi:hypothetical protein
MSDNRRRAMYDGFDSVTHGHSDAWVRVANEFMALAFAGDARLAKCPCIKWQNLVRLKKVELSYHVFKHGFMSNYLVWHEHGEVDHTIESDGDQDVDRMEEMLDDCWGEGEDATLRSMPLPISPHQRRRSDQQFPPFVQHAARRRPTTRSPRLAASSNTKAHVEFGPL